MIPLLVVASSETWISYLNRLYKEGIKYLDSGSFGRVYEHPTNPNLVVKLVSHDPAYMEFIKYAVKYGNKNPWFPKVVLPIKTAKVSKTSGKEVTVHFIFQERLYPLKRSDLKSLEFALFEPDEVLTRDKLFSFPKKISLTNSKNFPPSVLQVRSVLRQLLKQGFKLDLRVDNFMKRKNGQYVLIDPSYHVTKSKSLFAGADRWS